MRYYSALAIAEHYGVWNLTVMRWIQNGWLDPRGMRREQVSHSTPIDSIAISEESLRRMCELRGMAPPFDVIPPLND